MERHLRNRILIFLAVALVLALILIKVSGRQPVAKISAVVPVRQNVVASISSNGKVEPISPFVMRAQLDTFVEKIHVVEGQNVKKGQPLLELNVRDAEAQLAQARAKLLRAQENLRVAKGGGQPADAAQASGALATAVAQRDRLQRTHDALLRLIDQHAATKDELAANDLELAKAQAEVTRLAAMKQQFDRSVTLDSTSAPLAVQQAQSEVAALEGKVRDGHITAPSDGTLYSLPVKTGDYVHLGDLLAEMANLRQVRVRAFIDEPEIGALAPNQPVRITWEALPNRVWVGKTETVPKQVVARGSRSVGELLCTVDNDKLELLPNINVNVRINSKETDNVLAVPRGAVEGEGSKRYVYVVKHGDLGKSKLERREIQVGIADSTNYEIISGLQPGEMVALPGDVELKDGMAVRVMSTDSSNVKARQDEN
ncbi:MAG: efflux RND transporter periplasmic adaptor subunit [Candidatus Acidiferrum sp.]|jgi:HlyD family secretion protein